MFRFLLNFFNSLFSPNKKIEIKYIVKYNSIKYITTYNNQTTTIQNERRIL